MFPILFHILTFWVNKFLERCQATSRGCCIAPVPLQSIFSDSVDFLDTTTFKRPEFHRTNKLDIIFFKATDTHTSSFIQNQLSWTHMGIEKIPASPVSQKTSKQLQKWSLLHCPLEGTLSPFLEKPISVFRLPELSGLHLFFPSLWIIRHLPLIHEDNFKKFLHRNAGLPKPQNYRCL